MWQLVGRPTGLRNQVLAAAAGRLPVYTLTFSVPEAFNGGESLGLRIDLGDVVKYAIPRNKGTSQSLSAYRRIGRVILTS